MSHRIIISLSDQTLRLLDDVSGDCHCYAISTAKNGPGEQMDSECTPRGSHLIAQKIGAGCAKNTVFIGRQPTGEQYSAALSRRYPGRDWILARILWLRGLEPGKNSGGKVDTYRRYIYIHGSPAHLPMGRPGSRGCIRMNHGDIITLFDQVEEGTPVAIIEGTYGK